MVVVIGLAYDALNNPDRRSTTMTDTQTREALAPVESDQARLALVIALRALMVLDQGGYLAYIAEEMCDPKAAEQTRGAITAIERGMSPNLLITVLPAYTKVRFQTDLSREGEFIEGQTREGAWGLYPDRGQQALERRITTTRGFEFFVTPETVFTSFEITERPVSR
jgi:hypothetical protein